MPFSIDIQVLKSDRSTSALKKHLSTRHDISEKSSHPSSSTSHELCQQQNGSFDPDVSVIEPSSKRRKQTQLDSFLPTKHTARSEVANLVCVSNFSMNQVVKSDALRRVFARAYPGELQPPRSGTTLRKYLMEDAELRKSKLRTRLQECFEKGSNAFRWSHIMKMRATSFGNTAFTS